MSINLISKLKKFLRRFWTNPYTESEKNWMKSFCDKNNIDAKERLDALYIFLRSNIDNNYR